jgi:hypothetical protein
MLAVGVLAVFVLGLAAEFEVAGSLLGAEAHAYLVEGVGQTVVGDHVVEFLVAVAESFASLGERWDTPWRMKGARDIDSNPPASTRSDWSKAMDWAPKQTDFRPEEQTLLMVVQGTSIPTPPLTDAWRAGAWPTPALRTLPRMTSSISLGLRLMDSSAPLMANSPSSEAWKEESRPLKLPIGVLLAATM